MQLPSKLESFLSVCRPLAGSEVCAPSFTTPQPYTRYTAQSIDGSRSCGVDSLRGKRLAVLESADIFLLLGGRCGKGSRM
jgi:hypothetical protein